MKAISAFLFRPSERPLFLDRCHDWHIPSSSTESPTIPGGWPDSSSRGTPSRFFGNDEITEVQSFCGDESDGYRSCEDSPAPKIVPLDDRLALTRTSTCYPQQFRSLPSTEMQPTWTVSHVDISHSVSDPQLCLHIAATPALTAGGGTPFSYLPDTPRDDPVDAHASALREQGICSLKSRVTSCAEPNEDCPISSNGSPSGTRLPPSLLLVPDNSLASIKKIDIPSIPSLTSAANSPRETHSSRDRHTSEVLAKERHPTPTHESAVPSPLIIPSGYTDGRTVRHLPLSCDLAIRASENRRESIEEAYPPRIFTRAANVDPRERPPVIPEWESPRPAPKPPRPIFGHLSLQHRDHVFRVDKEIGSGGFGFVWHARDLYSREVAIKVINKQMFLASFIEEDPENVGWLRCNPSRAPPKEVIMQEFNALKILSWTNTVLSTRLLNAFTDKDNIYFVMVNEQLRIRAHC